MSDEEVKGFVFQYFPAYKLTSILFTLKDPKLQIECASFIMRTTTNKKPVYEFEEERPQIRNLENRSTNNIFGEESHPKVLCTFLIWQPTREVNQKSKMWAHNCETMKKGKLKPATLSDLRLGPIDCNKQRRVLNAFRSFGVNEPNDIGFMKTVLLIMPCVRFTCSKPLADKEVKVPPLLTNVDECNSPERLFAARCQEIDKISGKDLEKEPKFFKNGDAGTPPPPLEKLD
ncbi:hypothetical protein ACFE04_021964 [Oxalis oulophora]